MPETERRPHPKSYKPEVTFGVNAVILVALGLALVAIMGAVAMVSR